MRGKERERLFLQVIEGLIWAALGALAVIIMKSELIQLIKILSMVVIGLFVIVYIGIIYYKSIKIQDEYPKRNIPVPPPTPLQKVVPVENSFEQAQSAQILRTLSSQVQNEVVVIKEDKKHITKIMLINEERQSLKEWDIFGKTGLVIGKSTEKDPVDIDLSDTAFVQMISKQHAVLNYTGRNWCIDDIDSKNGTLVQKANQSEMLNLKSIGTVELGVGDTIYIAKTTLQVG